jgi:thiamine pyrophosphate-dependent acetolactate synthase large subunit-like protein
MVGTSFPYLEFLPKPGQARCIQIELDPARIGLRYPSKSASSAIAGARCAP